jgi:hypothetical protein
MTEAGVVRAAPRWAKLAAVTPGEMASTCGELRTTSSTGRTTVTIT